MPEQFIDVITMSIPWHAKTLSSFKVLCDVSFPMWGNSCSRKKIIRRPEFSLRLLVQSRRSARKVKMFIFPSVDNFLNQNINKSTRLKLKLFTGCLLLLLLLTGTFFVRSSTFFPSIQPELAPPCRKQTTQLFDDYDDAMKLCNL